MIRTSAPLTSALKNVIQIHKSILLSVFRV
jgi:hypothetical protein